MYCNEGGGTRNFIPKNKTKRINSVLTPSGSLGNRRTILSKVQIAVCSECKTETEVNPAYLTLPLQRVVKTSIIHSMNRGKTQKRKWKRLLTAFYLMLALKR